MRPDKMHKLSNHHCHDCGPKAWHAVPDVTGDYDLDATIMHRNNPDLPKRLELYVKHPGNAYGYRTGYNGYHGNHGDD
jgi:hypothetical protein